MILLWEAKGKSLTANSEIDLRPYLESERLFVRPLKADDFTALFEAASDPLIWEQHPFPDRYKKEVFVEFFAEAMASQGAFVVIDQRTAKIIGSSRFYEADLERSEVVIGYTFLTRAYWGGEYNRELKTIMLDHAFRYFKHVLFHVDATNIRSQKAMEKIGGVRTGQFDKTKLHTKPRRVYIYSISRPI